MKAVKWILIVGVVLAVLFGGVLAYVAATFDPNDYKDDIAKVVKDKTGRTLTFGGDLSLSVFPWIGATTGAITLSNAPGFGDAPFVKLNKAEVSVKLLPLLSGSVEIGTVVVDGLNLNLMRAKSGKTNWDDLMSAAEKEEKPASEDTSGSSLNLALGGLDVSNADVTWKDAKEGKEYALNNVSITLGEVAPGTPFDFKVLFGLSSTDPEVRAAVDVSGNASLDLPKKYYVVKSLLAKVEAEGKAVPGGKADLSLKADEMDADLAAQTLKVAALELNAMGLVAKGQASGTKIIDSPTISGTLDIPAFSLKSTLDKLGMALQTADDKALESVSGNMQFSAGTDFANVQQLTLKLDDTTIDGKAAVTNFAAPDAMFRLKVDAIDVDRYLPPASEKKEEAKAESAGPEADVIPVELLRKLTLDGVLEVGSLKVSKLTMTDVLVKVLAKGGVLSIEPASLKMYDGGVNTSAKVDARPDAPVTSIDATVVDVQAGKLVKDLVGKESFSGLANAKATLVTTGAKVSEMKKALNGDVSFKFNDGVIPGLNVDKMITETVKNKGDSSKTVTADKMDSTKYGEASGTAKIVNGVATNKDLLVKSPFIRVEGEGQVNLPKDTVDYLAKAKLIASSEGQGGKAASDVVGIWVPIRIKGPLNDPSIGVSIIEFLKMLGGGAIKGVTGMVEGGAKAVTKGVEDVGKSLENAVKPKSGTTSGTTSGTKPKKPLEGLKKLF